MKEADVQKWIQEQLKKKFGDKIYIFKVPQGQYTSRRGIPDLIAGIGGAFVAIEVKTEAGTLTKLQAHELDKINKAGSLGFTIYGKDEAMMSIVCNHIREAMR